MKAAAFVVVVCLAQLVTGAETFGPDGEQSGAGKTLEAWGKQAKSARSEEFRRRAVQTLVVIASGNSLSDDETGNCRKALIECLGSKDSSVRALAAAGIKEVGNESCLPALLQAAKDDSKAVQVSAITTLGAIGDNSCVDAIAELVTVPNARIGGTAEVTSVPISAINALAEIGTPEAKAALEKAAKKRPKADLREVINAALDRIDEKTDHQ